MSPRAGSFVDNADEVFTGVTRARIAATSSSVVVQLPFVAVVSRANKCLSFLLVRVSCMTGGRRV